MRAQADNYLLQLQCLGVEDGLSSRSVYGFLLDQRETLWIATNAGLDSYDGTRLTNHTIDQGSVNILFEGAAGKIWTVGYSNAVVAGRPTTLLARIHQLDAVSGKLRTLAELGAPPALLDGVTQMSAQPDGAAYFAARDGSLWRYHSTFERLTEPATTPIEWLTHTADGIAYLQGDHLRLLEFTTLRVRQLRTVDRSHALRLGTLGPSHIHVTELMTPYTTTSNYCTTVIDLMGRSVFSNIKNVVRMPLWLPGDAQGFYHATGDELSYSSWADSTTQRLSVSSAQPERTREVFNRISYVDRHGRIYAPVIDGFCVSQLQRSPFQSYLSDTMPSRSIRHIVPYGTKRAHVSTSYGLFYLAPDTIRQLTRYEFPTAHTQDSNGTHWFGYHGPIIRSITGAARAQPAPIVYLPETTIGLIATLEPAGEHTLHMGTDQGSFYLRTTDFSMWPDTLMEADGTPVGANVTVYQYFRSALDGTDWIVSDRGIFERLGPARWKHLPQLGERWYNHVHQDAAGIYWLGTRTEGLLRYDARTQTLTTFGEAEGLSDPCIYAVYEDDHEELWLSSNKGLMCVDKAFSRVRVYLPEQGLPHEEFNWGAHARDEADHLYFGGLNGFVRFHPDTVRRWEQEGQPELEPQWKTVLRVQRKNGRTDSLLATVRAGKPIAYQPEVTFLQAAITRPNFTRRDIRYHYRVAGQTAWKPLGVNDRIELGYLPYGHQVVEVAEQGRMAEVVLRLPLYLVRPVTARWWFVPLIVLSALLFGYLVFYWRLQRLEKRRLALRAEVDRQTEDLRKLNQFKDRFFSILSHDLRSPLLGLRGLSKKARFLLERERYTELTELGAEVDKSTEAIQRLIGNVFEWAQLQQGEYDFRPVCIHAGRLLEELRHIYQPLADERRVLLEFSVVGEVSPVVDLNALRTILRNLLDNALKNSPPMGRVRVVVGSRSERGWYMTVEDDGLGMHAAAREVLCSDTTTDATTRTLGLRLVRELVLLQNGRIEVAADAGTCVCVHFPTSGL